MERIIEFAPAYDKRDPDPDKNYGVHGVDIKFVLKGDKGAVQFLLFTNWYLPHVKDSMLRKPNNRQPRMIELLFMPMPADLGYHSKVKRYESQEIIDENCRYTDGPCYYDGSGLAAERVYNALLKKGDSGVWKELEDYYSDTFGDLDN